MWRIGNGLREFNPGPLYSLIYDKGSHARCDDYRTPRVLRALYPNWNMKSPAPYAYLPSSDLAFTRVVTASPEEIELARELRRLIQQRHLERSTLPGSSPYWCIAAD